MNRRTGFVSMTVFLLAAALIVPVPVFADGKAKYKRTEASYEVPDVTLIDQEGKSVNLRELVIHTDKPVFLDFIYATCTTICPVLSVGFMSLQKRLGPEAQGVRLVSVTIDPDNDKPEIMKEYLKRYNARPGWDFLTGNRQDIRRVMEAFDAYVPNKMSHYPITFLKAPGSKTWIRIYGLMGSSDLIREFEGLKN